MASQKLTSAGAMRAYMAVELLRSTGEREFPAQLMSIFFWIAAHDGCKQEDLAQECNISTSSVSRCVTWLGPQHRLEHRSGLKLIRLTSPGKRTGNGCVLPKPTASMLDTSLNTLAAHFH